MDDLEFIKKDVQKHLHEGVVFDDAPHMLRSIMADIAEAHIEAEAEDPLSDITDTLHDIVIKYRDARVR